MVHRKQVKRWGTVAFAALCFLLLIRCGVGHHLPGSSGAGGSIPGDGGSTPGDGSVSISSVSPSVGRRYLSQTLTIAGRGFDSGATVKIGDQACLSTSFVSSEEILCELPPSDSVGDVDVTVTSSTGESGVLAGGFRYRTFLIVGNTDSDQLSVFALDPVTGEPSLVPGSPFTATGLTVENASTQTASVYPGRFYYATYAAGTAFAILGYSVDPVTGALTQISLGNDAAVNNSPVILAADPQGRFLYRAGAGDTTLHALRIDSTTGELAVVGVVVPTGSTIMSAAVDPTGSRLYVTAGSAVEGLDIDQVSGALTAAPGSPFPIALVVTPEYLRFTSSGTLVISGSAGDLVVYDNALAGLSTPRTFSLGQTIFLPTFSLSLAGTHLFYRESASGDVRSNVFDPTLTPGNTVLLGTNALATATDPQGKFLYVSNNTVNTIDYYSVTAAGGLTYIGTVAAGGVRPHTLTVMH